jgi:hypothetical protein
MINFDSEEDFYDNNYIPTISYGLTKTINISRYYPDNIDYFVYNTCMGEDLDYDLTKDGIINSINYLEKNRSSCLDIDIHIKKTHFILMNGLINKKYTQPGKFSVCVRTDGDGHIYPVHDIKDWNKIIQLILDRFNTLYNKLIETNSKNEIIKLSVWLFSNLLREHPFSDGNGRLCRILLAYVLFPIIKLYVPIINKNYKEYIHDVKCAEYDDLTHLYNNLIISIRYKCASDMLYILD